MKKSISEVLNIILGFGLIILLVQRFRKYKSTGKSGSGKMEVYYHLMDKWMKLKEEDKSIADYMEQHEYKSVAIYGLGDIGKHLERELEKSKIEVKYAIDRAGAYLTIDLDVYSPESELPPVDAVIVTPVMDYDNICRNLQEKVLCPVLSIADIMNELLGVV